MILIIPSITLLQFSCWDDCFEVAYDFLCWCWYQFWVNVMCHWWFHCVSFDADANNIMWPKMVMAPYFDHLNLRNAMVPLMTPLASYAAMPWPKMSWCTLFYHFDLSNVIVPLMMPLVLCDADTNANGIMWHGHWYQWYYMKVMFHLISIILT